jgi:AcrR family transcriptional regulator
MSGTAFGQKGFDDTSTNDIWIWSVLPGETLYYHFKSKEEIMDALIERV